MNGEHLLTLESKEAIRNYLLKLFTIPAVAITVLSFLVGFLVQDVAQTKANLEASGRSMKSPGQPSSKCMI